MNIKLKNMRKALGLTQTDLAKLLDIDIKTVRNWEYENSYPNAEQVWNLAIILRCTPNDILGWYDEHPQSSDAEPLTNEEREIVDCYRESTPQWQQNIAMTARAASGESKKKTERSVSSTVERKAV